jgi:cobyrinic acid a,c-diamide synthase
MEDIQNQIQRNGLRWFGHVKRMDEHRIPKRLLDMKMAGKKTQKQTMNMAARSSQKRCTKKSMILAERKEWTDKDSWTLLCKSQPMRVETT